MEGVVSKKIIKNYLMGNKIMIFNKIKNKDKFLKFNLKKQLPSPPRSIDIYDYIY